MGELEAVIRNRDETIRKQEQEMTAFQRDANKQYERVCRERDEARQRAERMPWDRPELYGWSIVGMNHYRIHGQRHLFIAMTKDGRCIQTEGLEEKRLFDDLAALAADPQPAEAGGEVE